MRKDAFLLSLNDVPKNHIVIGLSGVPGAGKTTLTEIFIKRCGRQVARMIKSFTTRPRREDDRQDEYYYTTEEAFSEMEAGGVITWKVGAHGKHYGNSFDQFSTSIRWRRFSLIAITPETIEKIRDLIPAERLRLFHLVAPSEDEQRERLGARGECQATVEHRIVTSRTWEEEVWQIHQANPELITFIEQGSKDDMFVQLLKKLDLPT